MSGWLPVFVLLAVAKQPSPGGPGSKHRNHLIVILRLLPRDGVALARQNIVVSGNGRVLAGLVASKIAVRCVKCSGRA